MSVCRYDFVNFKGSSYNSSNHMKAEFESVGKQKIEKEVSTIQLLFLMLKIITQDFAQHKKSCTA